MAKRNALGRGLSALLENADVNPPVDQPKEDLPVSKPSGAVAMLSISDIEANPFQPRTTFDREALEELAQSIRELGIIQPITVRKTGAKRYQLISGERRFRASQLAELEEIPAYVRSADDQAMLEMALVENIQRENLDPIEIAISYQRLIEEVGLTQEALSEKVGKKRSTVTNYLRLLRLPAEIQVGLIRGKITMGHARALVNAGSEEEQLMFFKQVVNHELSVRQTEELVRGEQREKPSSSSRVKGLPPKVSSFQKALRERYGDQAVIRYREGKGRFEIPFDDDAQMRALKKLLKL